MASPVVKTKVFIFYSKATDIATINEIETTLNAFLSTLAPNSVGEISVASVAGLYGSAAPPELNTSRPWRHMIIVKYTE